MRESGHGLTISDVTESQALIARAIRISTISQNIRDFIPKSFSSYVLSYIFDSWLPDLAVRWIVAQTAAALANDTDVTVVSEE